MSVMDEHIDQRNKIFSHCAQSPIDINVSNAEQLTLPGLKWTNYERVPQTMFLRNSGETLILLPEWNGDAPYVRGGPFDENYIFSAIHFHWGPTINGSEHSVDDVRMPLEMHAIHYKEKYLKFEAAKKHDDGLLFLVYFCDLKSNHSPVLDRLLSKLQHIQKADTKVLIEPFPVEDLLNPFVSDYFLYYGSIATSTPTPVTWIITRKVTAISPEQVEL
ncbi:Carbonic anhydrase 5A, mitochondrial [Pseudolycoriella hygida]|uniref:Carbonic anhydrase 5A, mitochondrial n=1 Tax=Pseudolycoriella hygida TaxID=35572 RepID=A0A9Q0MS50_9DIPT|nr:Carbonic anhydrase 5A, mitochondrial [Pseudolycoriella hygida]